MPLSDTDSDEERHSTQSAPTGSGSAAAREVKSHPLLPTKNDLLEDLCSLKKAIRMYPLNEDHLKETGIPEELLVRREQRTTVAGASVYVCVHPKCQRPPFYSQSLAGLYSHVRRKHLGIALACPYCANKTYWNSRGWSSHMEQKHQGLPAYGHALADEATKTLEMLQRAHQPKTEDPVASLSSAGPAPKADTEDSSSDSASSTDEDLATEEAVSLSVTEPQELTREQAEAIIGGASAIRRDPPLESLQKFPFTALAPRPEVLAIRDRPPTTSQELAPAAAAFVASGLPSEPGMPPLEDVPSLDDMPPLEEIPPPRFPLKKRRRQADD